MATITELRPLKRRIIIMVDGRRFACVPGAWVRELELRQFDEVDVDELGAAIASRQFEARMPMRWTCWPRRCAQRSKSSPSWPSAAAVR